MNMDKLIGTSKITDVLPLLSRVARENNLRLNRAKEFKTVRQLLAKRYKIISYKLSILFISLISVSCGGKTYVLDPNIHYVNENFIIVEKWISGRHSDHYLLIRSTTDTTKYTEWHASDKTYWNKEKGDTVQFDYIHKNRFFNKQ